jgi:hypothetical protein
LSVLLWARQALAPLPLPHGPPCLGAAVAVVPCRAVLASPSLRRLAGGRPCHAGTAPCRPGGQRAGACCRVVVTRPFLPYLLEAKLPPPEPGNHVALPCFPATAALDPPSSPTLSPPPHAKFIIDVGSQRPIPPPRLRTGAIGATTVSYLERRSGRAYYRVDFPLSLDRHLPTIPG